MQAAALQIMCLCAQRSVYPGEMYATSHTEFRRRCVGVCLLPCAFLDFATREAAGGLLRVMQTALVV